MKKPDYEKHVGKIANLKMLRKMCKDKTSCWHYDNKLMHTFSYTFQSLLGCQAENPPRIRLEIVADYDGTIICISAFVQVWQDSPPNVGYSRIGPTPLNLDRKHVKEIVESVLLNAAAPVSKDAKAVAKSARQERAAKIKEAAKTFRQGLEQLNDDPAKCKAGLNLIHQAAADGNHDAQYWLAAMYGNGSHGVKKNDKLCMKYYEMAGTGGKII